MIFEMPKIEFLHHMVLKVRSYEKAKAFYCGLLKLEDHSQEARFLSLRFASFTLNFVEDLDFQDAWAKGVGHIGLEFETRKAVDAFHKLLSESNQSQRVSKISGGASQGPYRFYITDPHGYCLEFESWEGCSDA